MIAPCAFALAVLGSSRPALAQSAHGDHADVGIAVGAIERSAVTSSDKNPTGAYYGASFGESVRAHVPIFNWLRLGVGYQRAKHSLELDPARLEAPGSHTEHGGVLAYSIGARLKPILPITSRFRLFAVIGVGWGRMSLGKMKVAGPSRSYQIEERSGVFVEFPFGLGLTFDIVPHLLQVNAEATWAPNFSQSGSLFSPVNYMDSTGHADTTPPLPSIKSTFTQMAGLSVIL